MSVELKAVAGYNYTLTEISGKEEQFFRVDDKKSLDRIKEDSKYLMVKISAKKVVVLIIGRKDNKYSVVSNEYQDTDKWAKAIRGWFLKKLVRVTTKEEFYNTYNIYIGNAMREGETNV